MIVCYQYKVYWCKIYGVRDAGFKYEFYKPSLVHNGTLKINGIDIDEPICAWKIKQTKSSTNN